MRLADEIEGCITSDLIRQIMAKPKPARWIQLRGWGAFYSIDEDEISCGRIARLVPSDAWPAYIEQVVALLDHHKCFDAVCFACGVFGPFMDRAEAMAVAPLSVRGLAVDRARSDLTRLAFRKLRTGTTMRKLVAYLTEANAELPQPLPTTDLSGLAAWCADRHLAEKGARRDAA